MRSFFLLISYFISSLFLCVSFAQEFTPEENSLIAESSNADLENLALSNAATVTAEAIIPSPVLTWESPEVPQWSPLPGFELDITTTDPQAAEHVIAGIQYIHLFWDQQALRHFAKALEIDPECPLAWWGVAMSLLPQNNEFFQQRNLAIQQLPQLKEQCEHEWESILIDSLLAYISQNAIGTVTQLDALLQKKPADLNANLLKATMLRGTHAIDDQPHPDLQRAQELVAELQATYPDHPILAHYALRMTFPAPFSRLELAQVAAAEIPFAPLSPWLAYEAAQVDYIFGNFEQAKIRCEAGIELLEVWSEQTGATLADCPTLVDLAELQILTCLELAQIDQAQQLTQHLLAQEPESSRPLSAGMISFQHQAVLLPARIFARFEAWQQALNALPDIPELSAEHIAPWSWMADQIYYQGCLHIANQDLDAARLELARIQSLGATYQELAPEAISSGQRLRWHRAQRVMEQYKLLLQARLAQAEGFHERSWLWLRESIRAQERVDPEVPALILPQPREVLGFWALDFGDYDLARRSFNQGLQGTSSNQAPSWLGLALSFYHLGDPVKASAALERFTQTWQQAGQGSTTTELLAPLRQRAQELESLLAISSDTSSSN